MLLITMFSRKFLTFLLLLLPSPPNDAAAIPSTAASPNPNLANTIPRNASVMEFETIKTQSGLTIEPEHKILFRRLGTTAAIRAYGRILLQMELALPLAMGYNIVDACKSQLVDTNSTWASTFKGTITAMELLIEATSNSLDSLNVLQPVMDKVAELRKLDPASLPSSSSSSPSLSRHKRFLIALGLAAAASVVWTAGNTALGLSNLDKITQLTAVADNTQERSLNNERILQQLVSRMNDATSNVETINKELIKLNKELKRNQEENVVYSAIVAAAREFNIMATRIQRVATALLQGHVESSLVNSEELQAHLQQMSDSALTGQVYQPVISSVAEFVRLPVASGVAGGQLQLFIDVPLTLPKARLDVYAIHQVPMLTTAGFAELDSDLQYLAVSSGDRALFRAMTQREFDECRIIGQEIICPKALTTWKRSPATIHPDAQQCIFAAYRDDDTAMKHFCTLRMAKKATDVRQISAREVLLFLSSETAVRITCPNDQVFNHRFVGSILVQMTSACSIETDHFHHAADPDVVLEETIPAPTIRVTNVLSAVSDIEAEYVQEAAASSLTISQALVRSSAIQATWTHHPTSTPGVMSFVAFSICAVLASVLILQAVRRLRKRRRLVRIARARRAVEEDNQRLLAEQQAADAALQSRLRTGAVASAPLSPHGAAAQALAAKTQNVLL